MRDYETLSFLLVMRISSVRRRRSCSSATRARAQRLGPPVRRTKSGWRDCARFGRPDSRAIANRDGPLAPNARFVSTDTSCCNATWSPSDHLYRGARWAPRPLGDAWVMARSLLVAALSGWNTFCAWTLRKNRYQAATAFVACAHKARPTRRAQARNTCGGESMTDQRIPRTQLGPRGFESRVARVWSAITGQEVDEEVLDLIGQHATLGKSDLSVLKEAAQRVHRSHGGRLPISQWAAEVDSLGRSFESAQRVTPGPLQGGDTVTGRIDAAHRLPVQALIAEAARQCARIRLVRETRPRSRRGGAEAATATGSRHPLAPGSPTQTTEAMDRLARERAERALHRCGRP